MKIHTHVAEDTGLFANAYAVETADGHTTQCLSTLDKLRMLLADASPLDPGHGAPGTLGLLEYQYDYLAADRAVVAEVTNGSSTVDDSAAAELARRAR